MRKNYFGFIQQGVAFGIAACLLIPNAQATESIFGYNYTTDTLTKNKWEIAQAYYGKYGKSHGSYANSFYRTQIEYGLTSFFQSSLYFNTEHIDANRDRADRTTGGEGVPENAN